MKQRYLLLLSAALLASCGGEGASTSSAEDSSEVPGVSYYEEFSDGVLEANVSACRESFSLSGNITQRRYEVEEDIYGDYQITGDAYETNVYYSDVAFDCSGDEDAFYKYSYYLEDGEAVAAEGPYTYFEDENGYAYQETLDYSNAVSKTYASSYAATASGLTFADNGFYNFFDIIIEGDLTLNESVTAYTRYDLDINKAAIISNNLLYSLNSGAYCVPTEAYIRADSGTFTQLYIMLSPLISYDSLTGAPSGITNEVLFTFSGIGETAIDHLTPLEETETSRTLDAAFDLYEDASFVLEVSDRYEKYSIYGSGNETVDETIRYSFTGSEIFVHHVGEDESEEVDYARDYYLAPASEADRTLYPYAYDSDSGEWVLRTDTLYDEDGSVLFAEGYSGAFTYEQFVPIISELSGVFFEKSGSGYTVISDYLSTVSGCLLTSRNPFVYTGYRNAYSIGLIVTSGGALSIDAPYYYTDTLNGYLVTGSIGALIYGAGSVTLEGIIGQ